MRRSLGRKEDVTLFSVFDTNLYRGISAADLAAIVDSERSAGVTSLSAYWPCLELLAKVVSPEDQEREAGILALRRLVTHCSDDADAQGRMRIAADEEVLLAQGLFAQDLSQRLDHHVAITALATRIAFSGAPADASTDHSDLVKIAAHVTASEAEFSTNMDTAAKVVSQAMTTYDLDQSSARKQILEVIAATDTLHFLAQTRVLATARSLGLHPHDPEVQAHGRRVLEAFPVAMAVMRALLTKAVQGGVNWSRSDRANSLWDLKLAFHTSHGATIGGTPVLLVTDDGLLQEAARDAGNEVYLASRAEYLALLNGGQVPQRRAAMLALAA